MIDTTVYLTLAATALAGLGIVTLATLSGWRGWLELKEREFSARREDSTPAMPSASARIEIADLKERIRKLEAIAAGVDL
ncbi:MAG: hypothetical protein ACKVOB_12650 [Sphingomonas sp.]